jgi:hypothetical protein
MQKLTSLITAFLKDSKGSALIGAVAVSILLAIGSIGFIQVSTSSLNNEAAALQNEQAFHLAESGVWMAARWLRACRPFPGPGSYQPWGSAYFTVNGRDVYDSIFIENVSGRSVASIIVQVCYDPSGAHARNSTTFLKRIKVGNVSIQNFASYCTFFDSYQSDYASWLGAGMANWGGFANRNFYGRTHLNSMFCKIYDPSSAGWVAPRFFGDVTVAAPDGSDAYVTANYQHNYTTRNGGVTGNFGNNYDKGVWLTYGAEPSAAVMNTVLNQIFQATFRGNTDEIDLPVTVMNGTTIRTDDAKFSPFDKVQLPTSLDQGEGQDQYRPTLYFDNSGAGGTTRAVYEYRDPATGTRMQQVYSLAEFNNKIFTCSNNLNIYCTAGLKASVSVATDLDRSICPVGNLYTSAYSTATGAVTDQSSNNIIGLISGKVVRFNNSWVKWFSGDAATTAPAAANKAVSDLITGGTMHLNVSEMAVCGGNITTYNNTVAAGTKASRYFKGCELWDTDHAVGYSLKLHGNHILSAYAPATHGWGTGLQGGSLTFDPDPRMTTRFLTPPGFIQPNTTAGLWLLLMKGWSEENIL